MKAGGSAFSIIKMRSDSSYQLHGQSTLCCLLHTDRTTSAASSPAAYRPLLPPSHQSSDLCYLLPTDRPASAPFSPPNLRPLPPPHTDPPTSAASLTQALRPLLPSPHRPSDLCFILPTNSPTFAASFNTSINATRVIKLMLPQHIITPKTTALIDESLFV